jgi:hypothetical protein
VDDLVWEIEVKRELLGDSLARRLKYQESHQSPGLRSRIE